MNPVAFCNSGILRLEALCPEIGDEPSFHLHFRTINPSDATISLDRTLLQPNGMSLAPYYRKEDKEWSNPKANERGIWCLLKEESHSTFPGQSFLQEEEQTGRRGCSLSVVCAG